MLKAFPVRSETKLKYHLPPTSIHYCIKILASVEKKKMYKNGKKQNCHYSQLIWFFTGLPQQHTAKGVSGGWSWPLLWPLSHTAYTGLGPPDTDLQFTWQTKSPWVYVFPDMVSFPNSYKNVPWTSKLPSLPMWKDQKYLQRNYFNSWKGLERWLKIYIQKSSIVLDTSTKLKWNLEERALTKATKIYKVYKN